MITQRSNAALGNEAAGFAANSGLLGPCGSFGSSSIECWFAIDVFMARNSPLPVTTGHSRSQNGVAPLAYAGGP